MDFFKTALLSFAIFGAASAFAVPVTVNMTADNRLVSGGHCNDATCVSGLVWSALGSLPNADVWQQADSVTLDLDAGTHHFAWLVENDRPASADNPAGLLASISWAGGVNHSSSAWEVFSAADGSLIENATEYGVNNAADGSIWNRVNGGPIAGVSEMASWIYGSENFSAATPSTLFFRTSISIAAIPEPTTLGTLAIGVVALALARRRRYR